MMALLSKTTKPSASLKVGTWWFGFIDCPAYLCWGKNACLPAAAAYQKLRGHLLALRNIDVSPRMIKFCRFEKEPGAPAVRRDFRPVQLMFPDISHEFCTTATEGVVTPPKQKPGMSHPRTARGSARPGGSWTARHAAEGGGTKKLLVLRE
jgi:hypothetical protein